ncbi:HlyD family secretion protein [Mucilaginibacter aquariorum]|uniref:HlyD family secretion protein n=1 Tax=Mucilaginibacter aquariorum TaxID=2967225 RepID=A0ABT1T175_9SPHI|nr:HlyD family secretion protein [Mucilaginibacter aquariorum]MCQ6958365.1 HlyD family secretion protein [Mucilaginibacter aquariorum]
MNKKNKYSVTDHLITRVTAWIAGAIVLVLAGWGIISLWELYHFEETNDAQVQEYINPVISRAGGFIVAVKFEENQDMKKGDTLLVIDNREYVIQQAQTEAALLNARSQLTVLESNVETLTEISEVNRAQIAAAEAKVVKQQLDYARYQKLYEVESATKQQLENVQALKDVADADLLSANKNYRASLSKIKDTQAQQIVINAEIKRLSALLDRHKLDVSYTVITAPYNCRMGRRNVEKGQMIDAGQVLAYIVDQETDKWVVANYKETQIGGMQIGEAAEIEADAYPGKKFKGVIISLSPATGSSFSLLPPDNSTGNYVKIVQRVPVRIRLTGDRKEVDLLKAGMNVNVSISKQRS